MNASCPATYTTDGYPPDTFPERAEAMAEALRRTAVDHEFYYQKELLAPLGHN